MFDVCIVVVVVVALRRSFTWIVFPIFYIQITNRETPIEQIPKWIPVVWPPTPPIARRRPPEHGSHRIGLDCLTSETIMDNPHHNGDNTDEVRSQDHRNTLGTRQSENGHCGKTKRLSHFQLLLLHVIYRDSFVVFSNFINIKRVPRITSLLLPHKTTTDNESKWERDRGERKIDWNFVRWIIKNRHTHTHSHQHPHTSSYTSHPSIS